MEFFNTLLEARRRYTLRIATMIDQHAVNLKPDHNSVLPTQIVVDAKKPCEPLQRLMLAVPLDAIRCYQSNFGSGRGRQRIEFNEARQWLFHGCPEAPFSLHCVCSLLGVDPRTVQRTMSDWARRKRAGLAPVRLPRRTPRWWRSIIPLGFNRDGRTCDGRFAMAISQSDRAAVVLAGGEGTRLSAFIREMFGEAIPKQFCKFWDQYSLLEWTLRRAALLIDPGHTLTVLTASHARFYGPLLEGIRDEHVVVQPVNRGTAPAILYALMRLKKTSPYCSVALFPSDHFVDDDREFMRHVEAAFRAVDARPEVTILLGVEPTGPDTQYGWIEPGEFLANECEPVRQIRRFWEKPPLPIAERLMGSGWLWNCFVIVARLSTLLGLFLIATPELCGAFRAVEGALGTPSEKSRLRRLYEDIGASSVSDEVLAKCPQNLAVLRVNGVEWNDVGDPTRLTKLLERWT